MTRVKIWLAIAAAILVALPTAASAAGAPHGKRAAEHALKRVKDLKKGIGVRSGRELTPALVQLAARRGALDATQRKEAAELLARPTDPSDPDYYDAYIGDLHSYCPAGIFCFHWVDTGPDAPPAADTGGDPTVPDYIEQMAGVFNEVYGCENGAAVAACGDGTSAGLGWQQPVPDGSTGGGSNKFDVYIKDLYNQHFYGYAAPECPDPLTSNSCPAYMVMDKDYGRFPPVFQGETGLDAMSVTAAHEYNHVLQMSYDVLEDTWMFESTAVYMEEKVYPSIKDYFQYLPEWVNSTGVPLTHDGTPGSLKIYGSAVWNHWLDHVYGGDDVIQSAWSQSPTQNSFAPGAYDKSIRDRGGSGFPDEFENFAASVAEWGVPGTGYPDVYPDVPIRPSLTSDAPATSFTLDHTTFAFRDITPPATGVPLALTATLQNGLKGAVALVGRTGNSTTAGSVVTNIARTTTGGKLTVTLPDASTFGRITAVFVNADPTAVGPWSSVLRDWRFAKDGQAFNAVAALTKPQVATGSATPGATSATLNGTVNAIGAATSYWFEYGTSTAYGSQAPLPAADAGSGSADAAVSATATGLTPGTTYHYRLVAQGPGGTTVGSDQAFITASPPVATTGAATAIGVDSATLNATVDPRGTATTYVFEYGTSTTYGHKMPLTPGVLGSASQALAVATPVKALKPGATIHFRVVATSSVGTTNGADASFKTRPLRVLASVVRTKVAAALKRGVSTRPRCNANCSVTLQLLLPAKLAKRLHVKRAVATVKVKTGPGGRAVRLKFARKVARRLARQRRLALSLKLTATTPAGGRASATKSVKLG